MIFFSGSKYGAPAEVPAIISAVIVAILGIGVVVVAVWSNLHDPRCAHTAIHWLCS